MSTNVCCPQLDVVPCGDTLEHSHLVCLAWQTEGGITLDNEYIIHYCLRDSRIHSSCPCYPKVG